MQSSGFINMPDPRNILNLPSQEDTMLQTLADTKAINAGPVLCRSSHLKNKISGLVLPWNPLLAEQRDIMVNCDAYGNTDPAAWQGTVIDEEYTDDDRDRDYWAARETVVKQAMDISSKHYSDPHATSIPTVDATPPEGVTSLDAYYQKMEAKVQELDKALEF